MKSWNTSSNLFFILLLCLTSVTGCMTYQARPTSQGELDISKLSLPINKTLPKKNVALNYKIEGSSLFAGPNAIRDVLTAEAPYSSIVVGDIVSTKGDYISIKIEQTSPSLAATVFGYVSYSTLTLLPFWSSNDGSILTFIQYRDGIATSSKEYIVKRGTFVWLGMLPFAWINLITPSEEEAFKACTRDFLSSVSARTP